MNKKHFDCDCGWAAHGIVFELDEDDYLEIYIRNSRRDLSLWQRLIAAWQVVRGDDHTLSAVVLDRSQMRQFVNYVSSLMHNSNTS